MDPDALLTALADPARWRLVCLLAERPRPVGVLAQLAEARQPQTTKHLQTLERAGVVTSRRSGRLRVYALRPGPLRDLAASLGRLADTADRAGGPQETYDRYGLSLAAERLAAEEPGWADGRSFRFHRSPAGSPDLVWRHLTEPSLLARWWAPDDLRVSELVFEATPGGRILLEYRDIEDTGRTGDTGRAGDAGDTEGVMDTGGSDPAAGRGVGVVVDARPGERLSYRLSPHLPDGSPAFTAHVDFDIRAGAADAATGPASGTDLDVRYRITDSTVDSADFVAGIEIGFGQSLDKLVSAVAAAATHGATDTARTTPRTAARTEGKQVQP
ncbi:metalloregulator ArsR/SmtB family transcription factor [Streptomyces sp. Qhu_M48]|uniref:metalloregulator ArsR/SmtB family transcription factor n=1 Tax=Streptomyces sp. Qhu_M48 TaxID=3435889 RepID=UPI003F501808